LFSQINGCHHRMGVAGRRRGLHDTQLQRCCSLLSVCPPPTPPTRRAKNKVYTTLKSAKWFSALHPPTRRAVASASYRCSNRTQNKRVSVPDTQAVVVLVDLRGTRRSSCSPCLSRGSADDIGTRLIRSKSVQESPRARISKDLIGNWNCQARRLQRPERVEARRA